MKKELYIERESNLSFRVNSINEEIKSEIDKSGMMIVRNIASTFLNEKNANGRTYTSETLVQALKELESRGMFEGRQLLCTADDHPDSTFPKPTNSSHVVIGAKVERIEGKDVLLNDWLILNTRQGKDLQALINAGVSIGTSIRGLGRQDESTGEIHEYEYLGTDAVGNPSSGTFANFKGLNESVVVESVPNNLVEQITESQNKNKSIIKEDENMKYDLQEAMKAFEQKHSKVTKIESAYDKEGNEIELSGVQEVSKLEVTSSAVSDLLTIEKQVIENDGDLEIFKAFKDTILGEVSVSKKEESDSKDLKAESAKDSDTINKTERHLEASQIVAKELKDQNEELVLELESLRKYKESSNKLIGELTSRVKVALADVKERESSIEEREKSIVEENTKTTVQIVKDLQAETKEAIQQIETRLEHSIQFGLTISNYFFAEKAINEALTARLIKSKEIKEETINNKSSRVEKKHIAMKESRPHSFR